MPLLLNLLRPEQVRRLEAHAMPGGVQADDLAADAVVAANIAAGSVTTAKLAAGAATLPKSSFVGMKVLAAAGVAAAGPITLTGAAVGDRLIAVFGAPTAGGTLQARTPGTDFEATITIINQVQQSVAANLSANTYVFLLIPPAA